MNQNRRPPDDYPMSGFFQRLYHTDFLSESDQPLPHDQRPPMPPVELQPPPPSCPLPASSSSSVVRKPLLDDDDDDDVEVVNMIDADDRIVHVDDVPPLSPTSASFLKSIPASNAFFSIPQRPHSISREGLPSLPLSDSEAVMRQQNPPNHSTFLQQQIVSSSEPNVMVPQFLPPSNACYAMLSNVPILQTAGPSSQQLQEFDPTATVAEVVPSDFLPVANAGILRDQDKPADEEDQSFETLLQQYCSIREELSRLEVK